MISGQEIRLGRFFFFFFWGGGGLDWISGHFDYDYDMGRVMATCNECEEFFIKQKSELFFIKR